MIASQKNINSILFSNSMVRVFWTYGIFTLILSLFPLIVGRAVLSSHYFNYFFEYFQFFPIFLIIVLINNSRNILNTLYFISIFVAVSVIGYIIFVALGISVTTPIHYQTTEGIMYIHPIFGVITEGVGDLAYLRNSSFFLEPAKLAYFLLPMIFYSHYRWKSQKRVVDIIILFSLLISLLFSQSIGGIMSLLIVVVINFIFAKRTTFIHIVIFSIFIALLIYGVMQLPQEILDVIIQRRTGNYQSRILEWTENLSVFNNNFIGKGVGEATEYTVLHPLIKEYVKIGINNYYFEYISYFGIVGLIPLIYFVYKNLKIAIIGLKDNNNELFRVLSNMVLVLFVFNFSIKLLFFGYSLVIISIFYSEFNVSRKLTTNDLN